MSILQAVSMLFTEKGVIVGELSIDAVIEEIHTLSAKATEHPIEDGCNIADHIEHQPRALSLEGIISNTPLSLIGVPLFQSASNFFRGITNNQAESTFRALESMIEGNKTVTILTALNSYTDMVIENIIVNRNASSAECLRFSCTAKQIKRAQNITIEIPRPKIKRAQPKKSVGKQPAVKASEPVTKRAKSLLANIFVGT